jgi:hypothetical protein
MEIKKKEASFQKPPNVILNIKELILLHFNHLNRLASTVALQSDDI